MVPTVLKKGIAESVSTYHYANGVAVTSGLSAVTAILYTPTGGTLVASQSITPSGTGEMVADLTAGQTGTLYDNCRAHFQYTYDSQVHTKEIYFHIANTAFDVQFYFADLKPYYPNLDGMEDSTDDKFAKLRELARNELWEELANRNYQPWKIINLDELKSAFANLWLGLIWAQQMQSSPSYETQVEYHEKRYLAALNRADIMVDTGEDANRGGEEAVTIQQKIAKRG